MKATQVITGTLIFSSLLLSGLAPAQAGNLIRSWDVNAALSEAPYHNSNHNHVAWMRNVPGGSDFVEVGDILFNEFDDGTARLFGTVVSEKDANQKWDFNVWFEGYTEDIKTWNPDATAKKELTGSNGLAYTSGIVDPSDWWYYTYHSTKESIFTGAIGSAVEGESFTIDDITNGKHPVQVGKGANGKNTNMGLSTWFKHSGDYNSTSGHADFNIDLVARALPPKPSVDVPEPATMSFLSLGLLGLGMGALKRKNG
ncbi:PEP-CTERM sorting domain-containing protein [Roseofilum casamattae]|uniref:PEP-CTERM sorting domain-containing protein n=1 Tax=Roseofilum casamattae BLCC-M143 TaxID=3022442 RepID=A0ABT7BUS9_9CYAN|nr:PEP-CTERM sorting domain-containing protein [Roseofilum casamattae]MDJ1182940.1 PEP-CTERM sorting domain-containing protein [Roseofilum casamattae BLCC-M143]